MVKFTFCFDFRGGEIFIVLDLCLVDNGWYSLEPHEAYQSSPNLRLGVTTGKIAEQCHVNSHRIRRPAHNVVL